MATDTTILKENFRNETGKDVYPFGCCHKPSASYSDEYVHWLEELAPQLQPVSSNILSGHENLPQGILTNKIEVPVPEQPVSSSAFEKLVEYIDWIGSLGWYRESNGVWKHDNEVGHFSNTEELVKYYYPDWLSQPKTESTEIERLKGLIETTVRTIYKDKDAEAQELIWQHFKTENNI